MSPHPFGWSLPAGCSLSSPGGPEDPAMLEAEAAGESLFDGLYAATRAGFSVKEILEYWRDAAPEVGGADRLVVRLRHLR